MKKSKPVPQDIGSSGAAACRGFSNFLGWRGLRGWIVATICVGALLACGGGGGEASVVPLDNTGGGSGGGTTDAARSYTQANDFSAWGRFDSFNRTLDHQSSSETHPEQLSVLTADGDVFQNERLSAGNDGGKYVQWAWSVENPWTAFRLFQVDDVRKQRGSANFDYLVDPIGVFGAVDGLWSEVQLSHQGRYIAGAWAADNDTLRQGQSLLGILDTQAPTQPRGANIHIKNPPGGVGEKVAKIQWVSDNNMVVRNQSGRKFIWYVDSNTYDELPAMPRQWGAYTLTEEFYAPDGERFGGLMSADGGKTYEVWTSKPDYSDMQQVTLAGLKLSEFQWLGSSKYLMVHFQGLAAGADGNTCTYAILNANILRAISASQVGALRTPTYLPCTFTATR